LGFPPTLESVLQSFFFVSLQDIPISSVLSFLWERGSFPFQRAFFCKNFLSFLFFSRGLGAPPNPFFLIPFDFRETQAPPSPPPRYSFSREETSPLCFVSFFSGVFSSFFLPHFSSYFEANFPALTTLETPPPFFFFQIPFFFDLVIYRISLSLIFVLSPSDVPHPHKTVARLMPCVFPQSTHSLSF